MMRRLVVLLCFAALAAGCIGMSSDGEEARPAQLADETNETVWVTEVHEGTITGTSPFTPSETSEGQTFWFEAEPGIETLAVNVTAEGGELSFHFAGPDCDPKNDANCEDEIQTEDGEGQYLNETAKPGDWRVRVFPEPAGHQVDYEAAIAQHLTVRAES